MLNNADEPELEVPQPAIAAERARIEGQMAELARDAESRLDEAKFAAWLSEAAKTACHWTSLAPASAMSTGNATMTTLADR